MLQTVVKPLSLSLSYYEKKVELKIYSIQVAIILAHGHAKFSLENPVFYIIQNREAGSKCQNKRRTHKEWKLDYYFTDPLLLLLCKRGFEKEKRSKEKKIRENTTTTLIIMASTTSSFGLKKASNLNNKAGANNDPVNSQQKSIID